MKFYETTYIVHSGIQDGRLDDIVKKVEAKVKSIDGNILSKITSLIYLLDYSTIYAAVLNNTDPSPVDSIDFIKSRLWVNLTLWW